MTGVQTSPYLRRRLARVLVALLMAMALLLALAWSAGAFDYRTNLSRTSIMVSARPDLAVSADGEYVAVAWADFSDVVGSTDGKIRLRRSSVSDNPFWAEHKAVFDPHVSAGNGLEAKLAFGSSPTVAYVVWLWGASNVPTQLRYSKCDISPPGMANNCSPNGEIVQSVGSGEIVQPDIAVDDNGTIHFVWIETSTSQVRYRFRTAGGTWSSFQAIASPGSAPAIAFAKDGSSRYLHLAWVNDMTDKIMYSRGLISGGATSWGTSRSFEQGSLGSAGSPSVDARGNQVILVWDSALGSNDYGVTYNYSSDSGVNWQLAGAQWRLVPTGDYLTPFPDRVKRHSSEAGTYTKRLQPDVTLEIADTKTLVHVVWHEYVSPGGEGSERYDVYHSSADFSKLDKGSCSGDCWLEPTNVTSDTKDLATGVSSASATIAVGKGFTHTVYMEKTGSAWDAIYNGDLDASGSEIFMPVILKG